MRIYDLTEQAVNDLSYWVVIDDVTFTDAMKISVDNFLEPERTDRQADDALIAASAGLETDFSFLPEPTSNYFTAQDFIDAGYADTLKNAIRLLDTKIYQINNKSFIDATLTLSNAQLLGSFTSPITFMTAPAAGFFINLHDYVGKNNYGTAAYDATGTDTLDLICNSIVLGKLSHVFLESGVSVIEKGTVERGSGVNLTEAAQLTVKTTTTDLTTGDGTIDLRILVEVPSSTFGASTPTLSCCNSPVTGQFTNGDLNGAFQLVIQHNYNSEIVMGVTVIDPTGLSQYQTFQLGDGDNLFINKPNFVTVEFGAPIAAGTWTYYFVITT